HTTLFRSAPDYFRSRRRPRWSAKARSFLPESTVPVPPGCAPAAGGPDTDPAHPARHGVPAEIPPCSSVPWTPPETSRWVQRLHSTAPGHLPFPAAPNLPYGHFFQSFLSLVSAS